MIDHRRRVAGVISAAKGSRYAPEKVHAGCVRRRDSDLRSMATIGAGANMISRVYPGTRLAALLIAKLDRLLELRFRRPAVHLS